MVVPPSFLCGRDCTVCVCGGGGLCSVGEGWRLFHVNLVWKQGLGLGVGVITLAEVGQRR
jgi:hypothetical protein